MIQLKNILKIVVYASINILFGYIIYFISMRPLSPGEEQLIINFKDKTFAMFIIECFLFVLLFTSVFSTLSYLIFRFFYKESRIRRRLFLTIITIYFLFTCLCNVEYFNYINQLIYNK